MLFSVIPQWVLWLLLPFGGAVLARLAWRHWLAWLMWVIASLVALCAIWLGNYLTSDHAAWAVIGAWVLGFAVSEVGALFFLFLREAGALFFLFLRHLVEAFGLLIRHFSFWVVAGAAIAGVYFYYHPRVLPQLAGQLGSALAQLVGQFATGVWPFVPLLGVFLIVLSGYLFLGRAFRLLFRGR
ncbi:MAG: hypothetical protein HY001_00160 [Candidatus Portnoybacteria bacterium]|nr:hypothetical protein [Candidatus Portnoybacteria bacterium]